MLIMVLLNKKYEKPYLTQSEILFFSLQDFSEP